jgi:hypothetical protein
MRPGGSGSPNSELLVDLKDKASSSVFHVEQAPTGKFTPVLPIIQERGTEALITAGRSTWNVAGIEISTPLNRHAPLPAELSL